MSYYAFPGTKLDGKKVVAAHAATIVKQESGLSFKRIKSRSNVEKVVEARHILFYLLKKRSGLTLRDISNFIGGRDKTTIIRACHGIESRAKYYPEFAAKLEHISNRFLNIPV